MPLIDQGFELFLCIRLHCDGRLEGYVIEVLEDSMLSPAAIASRLASSFRSEVAWQQKVCCSLYSTSRKLELVVVMSLNDTNFPTSS